jgi:oligopeptidase A
VVVPIEELSERLGRVWGVVGHLMGVRNDDAIRAAHERMQPDVVALSLRLGQSAPFYQALRALRDGAGWEALDATQRRIVESLVREAELSGVGLEGAARARFNVIQAELAELATRFSNDVLDATKAFALDLATPDEVDGLPPTLLALAAQTARAAGHEQATAEQGPWRITLDLPSYVPFMEHGRRRDLRERLYRAYLTRASEGDWDNTPLMTRILARRREQARLLGYDSYAALSLATKMAPDVATVERLLDELRQASWDAAHRDHAELTALARERGAPEADDLRQWDVPFWAARLREARFDYTDEELRPYFPLPHVLQGLFALSERLFGVRIEAADGEAPVWHEDVRFFRVFDASGTARAAFYLDPYSRPAEKRGGAWMDECVARRRPRGAAPRKYNEHDMVLNAIRAHHDEEPHRYAETFLVTAADAVSGARPGARREMFETYVKRLEKLEEIATSFAGVERCFAIQAGREVRVMVNPEDINDQAMTELTESIARRLEDELQYPGQIKVVVIRETRAVDFAR